MSKETLEVDPFSINLERFAIESVGHAHTINLPAGKELRFQCDFASDFELGVKVIEATVHFVGGVTLMKVAKKA